MRDGAVVIVSSQLPVGSVARLEAMAPKLRFAASPENLRLGKAIEVFTKPDRVIVGVRDDATKATVTKLFAPITDRIEWMSVESAEMTKHAINAFLALSVTFANELASVCERVGADAKEVERGLKTESRIGPKAYLAPGGAFAGGTLARDVAFLTALGKQHALVLPLLGGVRPSNEAHKHWPQRRLIDRLGEIAGKTIAVWGLTYKAGTDTLRRSASVELCRDLAARGAKVVAWDPALVGGGDNSTALVVPVELQGPWHIASAGAAAGGAASGGATSSGATSGGALHVEPSSIAPSIFAASMLAPAPYIHAPHVARAPDGVHGSISLARDAASAIDGADALVIATEWPQFRDLDLAALTPRMRRKLILDANRFLAAKVAGLDIEYYAVGVPTRG
jgi:UDP-glucose 6-dehydrogenase